MGLRYTSAVADKDKIWLLAPDLSILCALDKDTKKLEYVADLSDRRENKFFLYYGIVKAGDCIFAFPCAEEAEELAIYDILQDKVEYRKIEWGRDDWKKASHKIVAAYVIRDFLYLVGQNLPIIIKINLQNFDQQIFDLGIKFTMWKNIEQIGERLFIPSLDSRTLVVFDATNDTFELKELPIETEGVAIIRHCEGQLVVVPADAAGIYEINIKKWSLDRKYIVKNINGFCYKEYPFDNLFIRKDSFYLFPYDANMIVKISRMTGEAESMRTYSDAKNCRYHGCFAWDEHYIAGSYSYGMRFDLYHIETDKLEQYRCVLPENIYRYWRKRREEGYREELDESRICLSGFIKLVLESN